MNIGKPIPMKSLSLGGDRNSKHFEIYKRIRTLTKEEALPVHLDNRVEALNLAQALRSNFAHMRKRKKGNYTVFQRGNDLYITRNSDEAQ